MEFLVPTIMGDDDKPLYTQADLEATAPQVMKAIESAPLTVYALQGALYDAERVGVGSHVDISDYVKAIAAAAQIRKGADEWTLEEIALMMHLEYLKITLKDRVA